MDHAQHLVTRASPSIRHRIYKVVNDEKNVARTRRVGHKEIRIYDVSYYKREFIRAVKSILSPLGWDRTLITWELNDDGGT